MAIQGMHQVQKQAQTLALAPQLRQSFKVLQAPAMDLRHEILSEIEINPLLEELPSEGPSIEERLQEEDSGSEEQGGELDFDDQDFEIFKQLDIDWREHFADEQPNGGYTSEDAERRQYLFDSVTTETSLQEHLMQQAGLSDLDETEMRAMAVLVGSLNVDGFLEESISDLALREDLPLPSVQRAHEVLRGFDPPGIGARDRADCLLLQLEARGEGDSIAARIIREHFPLLLRRRIPELARKMKVDSDTIQQAMAVISRLDPSPGRKFAEDANRVVVPDVTVFKDGGEWRVVMNNDYIPRLRISSYYKDLIGKGALGKKEKAYILEKMRAGRFLISSIEQRQQTIERITRILLRFQADFFEHGVSKLRPLTMSKVAAELGVHETTVSRAVANKYVETPFGVFELKYFFTAGFKSASGEEVSNRSIKDRMAQMIEEEDSSKPLSDQEIMRRLNEGGVKVARRTVAKYREEMGILPTNLRRKY